MNINLVSIQNVLLVGYGISGKSTFDFLTKQGHRIYVYDDDINKTVPNRIVSIDDINWNIINIVIKSPSIHIMLHNRHPLINQAIAHKKTIYSTFDIFQIYNPNAKIIAITGTNGKSTTTELVYYILKNEGISIQIGGNIGIPYTELNTSEYYVFEMSSYELTSSKLSNFYMGALLNIEPDHIDFHGSFENYIESKHTVLNCSSMGFISCEDQYSFEKYKDNNNIITISTNYNPKANYYVHENLLIDNNTVVLDLSNLKNLIGKHNYQNIIFAYAICRQFNIEPSKIVNSIRNFKALSHRMNIVRKMEDVLFINDSKATNPSSAGRALETFIGYKIFWLVGGRSKKVNPMPYIENYLSSVQKIYLFGESSLEFADVFSDTKPFVLCQTMENALKQAYVDAIQEVGTSVILLSPMCASFDQFSDFEQRGNTFVKLVNSLK